MDRKKYRLFSLLLVFGQVLVSVLTLAAPVLKIEAAAMQGALWVRNGFEFLSFVPPELLFGSVAPNGLDIFVGVAGWLLLLSAALTAALCLSHVASGRAGRYREQKIGVLLQTALGALYMAAALAWFGRQGASMGTVAGMSVYTLAYVPFLVSALLCAGYFILWGLCKKRGIAAEEQAFVEAQAAQYAARRAERRAAPPLDRRGNSWFLWGIGVCSLVCAVLFLSGTAVYSWKYVERVGQGWHTDYEKLIVADSYDFYDSPVVLGVGIACIAASAAGCVGLWIRRKRAPEAFELLFVALFLAAAVIAYAGYFFALPEMDETGGVIWGTNIYAGGDLYGSIKAAGWAVIVLQFFAFVFALLEYFLRRSRD